MNKRFLSVLTTFGLIAGLVAFAAPAQANHTTVDSVENFMPRGEKNDKDALSDVFDGQNSTAHLTAVADPAATQATWYVCNPGDDPGDPTCTTIGTDTSGTQPQPVDPSDPDADSQSAEAYDFNWDIPAALNDAYGDIWVLACNGAPNVPANPDTSTNCASDVATGIYLDDGGTSANPPFGSLQEIPTGEIALWCAGGKGGFNPDDRAECDQVEEGTAFPNGAELANSDLAIGFTTSEDVTLASACIDDLGNNDTVPTDADTSAVAPEGCDSFPTRVFRIAENNPSDPDPGHAWIAFFEDSAVPDGGDVDVAIFGNGTDTWADECANGPDFVGTDSGVIVRVNNDGTGTVISGSGVAEADVCVFDEHYASIPERTTSSAVASFDIDGDDGCDTDDGEVPNKDVTNIVYDDLNNEDAYNEQVEGCLFNQFGVLDPTLGTGEAAVYQLEGVGEIDDWGWGDCTDYDLDSDGQNETAVCQTSGGDETGEFSIELDPLWDDDGNVERGDATLTFCLDEEGDDMSDPEFGCADETIKDTITKSYVGSARDVNLVFQTTGMTDEEACVDGDKFRVNTEGDTDTLLVCTFDNLGNLVSTQNPANTNKDMSQVSGRLSWDNSNPSSVAYTQNPPSSTGTDGTNTMGITAVSQGGSTITVTLDYDSDDGGDRDEFETSSVTKTVQQGTGSQPQCNNGIDDDGDGLIDFPLDPGCAGLDDNTEIDAAGEVRFHNRTAKLTRFQHVPLGGGKRSLKVKGRIGTPDGFTDCKAFVPAKVQIKTPGGWVTRKSTFTNGNGRFSVLIRDIAKKYRVVAPRFELSQPDASVDVCKTARSKARRHRH